MTAEDNVSDPNFMLSLAKGLGVLRAFEGHSTLSVAEAARASGLSRPSASRCLHTLACLGYVREAGGRFSLTPKLLPLAAGFLTSAPLASASQAVVNTLRNELQETFSVGSLDPSDPGRLIYIARAERNQVIAAPLMVGSTLPSHCTSMGRVLLASLAPARFEDWLSNTSLDARTAHTITSAAEFRIELQAIREQRWSLVEEELEAGLRSLAVPVRDRDGNILAALNVATFSNAYTRSHLIDQFLPALRAAAVQLERAI